jgi:hypothetical protein
MAIGTACRQAGTPLLKPRSFWFRAFLALYFSIDVANRMASELLSILLILFDLRAGKHSLFKKTL